MYELSDGLFEGVIRWGSQEGTAIGGDTIRYPLGNKSAVDYYVNHFRGTFNLTRGFYGIVNKLTADTAGVNIPIPELLYLSHYKPGQIQPNGMPLPPIGLPHQQTMQQLRQQHHVIQPGLPMFQQGGLMNHGQMNMQQLNVVQHLNGIAQQQNQNGMIQQGIGQMQDLGAKTRFSQAQPQPKQ